MPEGHQGLHGFLYGEDGAEAHEGGSSYTFREVRPLGLLNNAHMDTHPVAATPAQRA